MLTAEDVALDLSDLDPDRSPERSNKTQQLLDRLEALGRVRKLVGSMTTEQLEQAEQALNPILGLAHGH